MKIVKFFVSGLLRVFVGKSKRNIQRVYRQAKEYLPYIFVCALFFVMVSNELLTRGMFMDGLIYSSIAKNLSQGIGSFWHLTCTKTLSVDFYGHPPLMMFLLGLWFDVFGVSMLAAKGYALLIVGLNVVMIVAVWCKLGFKLDTGWLPLLLLLLIPLVSQSVFDNYLECTMSVFILIAVWCVLHEKGWLWPLLGGFCLVAAFMTKGFTGLFPLALPFIVWGLKIKEYHFLRMSMDTCVMLIGLVIPMVLIWLTILDAAAFLSKYLNIQVYDGIHSKVTPRSYILIKLLAGIAIPLVITTLVVVCQVVKKTTKWKITTHHWRVFGVMFALVLCGSLPIMISTKQRAFFLLTVFPYVAISFAALIEPLANIFIRSKNQRWFTIITGVLLVCAVVLNIIQVGKPGRDTNLINDMDVIAEVVSDGGTITIPSAIRQRWNLQGYWYFYHNVSLDNLNQHNYLLTTTDIGTQEWDGKYQPVELPTIEYKLYKTN